MEERVVTHPSSTDLTRPIDVEGDDDSDDGELLVEGEREVLTQPHVGFVPSGGSTASAMAGRLVLTTWRYGPPLGVNMI